MINQKEKDLFEKAPILKAILKLAIPSVIGQLILVIYNLADTFFIGLASQDPFFTGGSGSSLIAGVTVCMPIFMIISAISNLFGIGACSVMSRAMGGKNFDRAKNASRFAFYGCLVTSVVYCLLVLALLNPITKLLAGNAGADVQEYAKTYILITVVGFGVPTALNTLFSHLFRAEGKSFHASFGICLGGVLNVLLDYLFIFLAFPIKDAAMAAALATGISNFVALVYYIVLYIRKRKESQISLKFKKSMFADGVHKEVLVVGLPAFLMTLCENVSYFILDANMAAVSATDAICTAALAGVGAAKKVNMAAHSIARGMTQGVLPLIGYNKANGKRIRMKKIFYTSAGITTGIAVICLLINIFCATPLCNIFVHESDALKFASIYLIIFSIGAPFSAFAYSVISFFQAVGKPWRSLILALLRKGILDIPLMYILPYITALNYAPAGEFIPGASIVWATPISDIVCCVVAVILFVVYIRRHAAKDKNIPDISISALPNQ